MCRRTRSWTKRSRTSSTPPSRPTCTGGLGRQRQGRLAQRRRGGLAHLGAERCQPESGGEVTEDGEPTEIVGWTPRDDFQAWQDRIRAAFEHWDRLPDPDDFTTPLKAIYRAEGLLALQASTDGTGQVDGGNIELAGDLETMNSELAQFNGATMDTFTRHYTNRLPVVIGGQYAIVCALGIGLTGEREIWRRARAEVAGVADAALAAMKGVIHGCDKEEAEASLSVAGAAFAAIGLFVSGGTAVLAGGAAIGLGLLKDLLPEDAEPDDEDLRGGIPDEVCRLLAKALAELDDQINDAELSIGHSMSDSHHTAQEQRESFDLRAPTQLLEETDVDNILAANGPALLRVARDVMPNIALQLRRAAAELPTPRLEVWDRPGPIGYGWDGPRDQWTELKEHLHGLLKDTEWEIREAAEHLEIAAMNFQESDEAAGAALARHRREVRHGSPVPDHDPDLPRNIPE